jgi:hypothetical protein
MTTPGHIAGRFVKEGHYTVYCPMDEHKDTLKHRLAVVAGRVPTR